MTTPITPSILICGNLVWSQKDAEKMFVDTGIANIITMDSPTRSDFYAQCQGGKYTSIVGIYRHNTSADRIGVFDEELIGNLPKDVKWIAHNGAGYDQIDVHACIRRAITVSNTPTAVDDATATTALYLLISACRQFSLAERSLRAVPPLWKSTHDPGQAHDPSAMKVGVLGLGGIGRKFAEMCQGALRLKEVFFWNRSAPSASDEYPPWLIYVPSLQDFLSQVDVVSVHISLNAQTEHFMGRKELGWMKKGSILINTARGKIVDEDALIEALESGHLSSAGLDVYPSEPDVNSRLLSFPRVTLLPHMGTETREAQHGMELRALGNLRDWVVSGKGGDVVKECVMAGMGDRGDGGSEGAAGGKL